MRKDDQTHISPLTPHSLSSVQAMIGEVIEGRGLDDLRLIKQAQWIAVPVESAAHFDRDDQQQLVNALCRRDHQYLYALIFEGWDRTEGLMVRVCQEGIAALDHAYSHFNIVLITEGAQWICIATVREYFIYLGMRDMIEDAVGRSIEDQYAAFLRFATDSAWPRRVRDELTHILQQCRDEYAQALPGTPIKLLMSPMPDSEKH